MNREAWLNLLVDKLRPEFAERGYTVPDKVRISCGWPSRGATARNNRTLGQCWNGASSADGSVEIFLSPTVAESMRIADIVVHELIHACLPNAGHGALFKRAASALNLGGKATATTATPELLAWLAPLVAACGDYPHAELLVNDRVKKQTTRLLKVACAECGYTVRVTQCWIDRGYPVCPCGSEMVSV